MVGEIDTMMIVKSGLPLQDAVVYAMRLKKPCYVVREVITTNSKGKEVECIKTPTKHVVKVDKANFSTAPHFIGVSDLFMNNEITTKWSVIIPLNRAWNNMFRVVYINSIPYNNGVLRHISVDKGNNYVDID